MTVNQLIELLQGFPGDLPVHVNNEGAGVLHKNIECVFEIADDPEYGDEAAVIIAVNTL